MTDVKILRVSGIRSWDIIDSVKKVAEGVGLMFDSTYLNLEFCLFDNTAVFLIHVEGAEDAINRFNKLVTSIPKIKSISTD